MGQTKRSAETLRYPTAPGSFSAGRLQAPRRTDDRRQRKQGAFLTAFAEHATVSTAATAVHVSRRTHYNWLETDGGLCRAVQGRRGGRLKVETQNINVPACRFYEAQGCILRAIDRCAYPQLPNEVRMLWYKDLVASVNSA